MPSEWIFTDFENLDVSVDMGLLLIQKAYAGSVVL